MKNKIFFLSIIASFFITLTEAQNRTTVNAMSNEISDNLDLRAVASIFGDSRNLEDFERRLNDPELQISNLDLNNDNEVDYLRVIETVDYNTHVVIIQAVLDRDVYQDVATIDIVRDNYNRVQVHFIGNEYMYGPNYIYEPVYYSTPLIYASFWISNYRPYVSNWYWNYYPSYYYAWNPYPVYRYRNNISLCLNFNNSYNYVSYRRSNLAISLYNTRRSNAYERRYPNYAFTRRYSNYSNRYDLEQRRGSRYTSPTYRNSTGRQYNESQRRATQRDYSSNRTNPSASRQNPSRDYSENRSNNSRQTPSRNYNENNGNNSRDNSIQRAPGREYNQNNGNSGDNSIQRAPAREYNQNNSENSRQSQAQQSPMTRQYTPRQENAPQREQQNNRENSQNRGDFSRSNAPMQRSEPNGNNGNRGENNNSSRNNNRRI